MGEHTFYGCRGLTSVTNLALTPQTVTSEVFYSVFFPSCKLYVYHESIEYYKVANVWKNFDIQDLGGVEGVKADETANEVEGYYNLNGVRLEEPA